MSEPAICTAEQLWMPGFIANPYPTYHHLRDHSQLLCMTLPAGAFAGVNEPIRMWALMKHEDVSRALRDHETFVSGRSPLAGKAYPKLVLLDDPPRHTQLRRLVNKAFTPKRIEALVPWITSVANALLDAIDTAETDLVQSYTMPLPIKVIAHLLGIPTEEYETFKRWSDATIAYTTITPEARAQSDQEMMAYFGRMALARRAHGGRACGANGQPQWACLCTPVSGRGARPERTAQRGQSHRRAGRSALRTEREPRRCGARYR